MKEIWKILFVFSILTVPLISLSLEKIMALEIQDRWVLKENSITQFIVIKAPIEDGVPFLVGICLIYGAFKLKSTNRKTKENKKREDSFHETEDFKKIS